MIGDPSFSTTIGTVTSTSVGVLVVLAGYLLGAIPFALLVGRWQRGVDIRRYGSGNLGTTNVLRTMGWKASAIVFVLDNAKSFVPVIVARALTGSAWWASAAALAAIVGHCWSVYVGWKGGRGVTSSLGALLAIQPIVGAISLAICALIAWRTRFVSLGSLVGVFVAMAIMLALIALRAEPVGYLLFAIGSPVIVYARHLGNIRRLIAGTERKFGQKAEELPSSLPTNLTT